MSNGAPRPSTGMNKERARSGLSRLQAFTGVLLLASTLSGAYLLYTDGSLWLLAVSHALGLVLIVAIDAVLGLMNLLSSRRVYLPTIAAAVLAIVLQLGDIATAPQYNMTVAYFASYLFGLWAFDLLLGLQAAILVLGAVGRPYAVYLARRKSRRGRELDYSRRGFLKSVVALAGLIGVGVVLGSVKLPTATGTPTTSQTQSGLPSGAIANVNAMKPGSPVYFEYPAGYPNILTIKADGSLAALSILCTHVCCECEYVQSNSVIACPCHGSVFDLDGNVLTGPAIVPLPSISLRTDGSGNVFPTGVSSAGPCQV
ncbi:MAG: Rieske 2Fe-2S domain-containing protein [Nitrososphaerales archaeon]|nr:Rieske 2Fe-2S domain-containing protein [Nitrososphaerales archaeon]